MVLNFNTFLSIVLKFEILVSWQHYHTSYAIASFSCEIQGGGKKPLETVFLSINKIFTMLMFWSKCELEFSSVHTGTLTLRNISAPLRASSKAISCGVETMTAPGNQKQNEWDSMKLIHTIMQNLKLPIVTPRKFL